jgi:broad specificity phosphatase PhoE
MTQFYLIRHGEAYYELATKRSLIGGAREFVPLTQRGEQQVEELAQVLKKEQPQLILVSPMTRALQTAALLNRVINVPLKVAFDLHEWWPDLTFRYASSEESLDAFFEMMAAGGEWPQGETRNWEPMSSVRRRVKGVLAQYTHLERVFVVCHGVVIRSLLGEAIDVAEYRLYHLENSQQG